MKHWYRRQLIQGYTDMGTPLIPPPPAKIGLLDRVDGRTYYLLTTGSYPAMTVVLSSTALTDNFAGVRTYDAYFGPVLNGRWRLFSASGALAIEALANASDTSQTRIFARNATATDAVEVTAPGGVLTYTNIQL